MRSDVASPTCSAANTERSQRAPALSLTEVADSFSVVAESARALPSAGTSPMSSVTPPASPVTNRRTHGIQADFARKEERVRSELEERPEAGHGEGHSQGTAGAREEQALHQQLPREPPRGRAERRTHRHLPLSSHRPGQEEARDIGTGDEQQNADGAEEQ